MAEFNASRVLGEVEERNEELLAGTKIGPVSAAVIAVFAALATLFANHSSITGLAQKNEGILYQSKASDQYNYYESKRIKVQLNQAIINAGLAKTSDGRSKMEALMNKEDTAAKRILKTAQTNETESEDHIATAERYMRSYESYEVAATLFEVSIVLVSITALMRNKSLILVGGAATLVGIGFFFAGLLVR